jgi:hypothetical protein
MGENDFATNGNDGMVMFQTHVGVSVLNGVWDIPIIMGMKPKRILGDTLGKMQWLMPFIGFDWRYRKWKWEK